MNTPRGATDPQWMDFVLNKGPAGLQARLNRWGVGVVWTGEATDCDDPSQMGAQGAQGEQEKEQFLDLIDAYFSFLLKADEYNIPEIQVSLSSSAQRQLAGRKAHPTEAAQIAREKRLLLQCIKAEVIMHFLYSHGLTTRRFEYLYRQLSTHTTEVKTLREDWQKFFVGEVYTQRLLKCIAKRTKEESERDE